MTQPDWVTLTAGEEVVWEGRPVIYPYLWGTLKGLTVSLVGVVLWLLSEGTFDLAVFVPSGTPVVILAGLLVVLGVVAAGHTLITWACVHYLVTTDEVYKKRGFVSRTVDNLRLEQIQNTSFSQSVVGRVLSYGHVQVDTAGGSSVEMTYEYVPEPELVVTTITRRLDDAVA